MIARLSNAAQVIHAQRLITGSNINRKYFPFPVYDSIKITHK